MTEPVTLSTPPTDTVSDTETPANGFAPLGLAEPLLRAIEQLGYTVPTPIQARALPVALAGRDVLASANTGTGKTAAFVLPALQRLTSVPRRADHWGPRVLVLTPTRELATQVLDAVRGFSKFARVHTGSILGGMPYRQQLDMLRRRIDLIVATPGRLIDHMERDRIDLTGIEMLVLDEADRMLDMGFRDAVEHIAGACPAERQTLLFTATLDDAAARLAGKLLSNPERIDVAGKVVTAAAIDQRWLKADGLDHKHALLDRLLSDESFGKGIVFTATKADADRLADELSAKGHKAMPLHGDMQQRDRNRVVQWLRDGRVNVVVATDVAARGIDVADLSHVINFDLPRQAEDYVHRIGRTGRAGATGTAWSLFHRAEWRLVKAIEVYTNCRAELHTLPGLEPAPEPERKPRPPGSKPFGKKPFGHKGGKPHGHHWNADRAQNGGHGGEARPQGDRPWRKPRPDHAGAGPRHEGARPEGARFDGPRRDDRPARAHHHGGAAPLRRQKHGAD